MEPRDREFDVIVWGASGFTGQLVVEYLLERYGSDRELRWALGGRNASKLEAVRREVGESVGVASDGLPIVLGDSDDAASLRALAARTRVVCSTVGPYARYGSKLVAACARQGTHYCDLTGEVHWMRRMIDAHDQEARETGARIVHACGFDSIPSDMGVFFVQREMRARHGTPADHVKGRVESFSGGFSGGTIASMLTTFEDAARDPEVRRIMADPYALDPAPGHSGPDGPDVVVPTWDADFDQWTGAFVMAGVNTRVVRRSNALLAGEYGPDFRYDEAMLMGTGPAGWLKAAGLSAGLGAAMALGSLGPLRRALGSVLPAPGEGPSKKQREAGSFDIRLFAAHPEDRGKSLHARVTGDRDPGYGSTSKMLGESAVCLALDPLAGGGGFTTPAAGMGDALLDRLGSKAGLDFTIASD